jgi:hypothetical protein
MAELENALTLLSVGYVWNACLVACTPLHTLWSDLAQGIVPVSERRVLIPNPH